LVNTNHTTNSDGEGDLVVDLRGGGGASVILRTGAKKVYGQAAWGSGNGNTSQESGRGREKVMKSAREQVIGEPSELAMGGEREIRERRRSILVRHLATLLEHAIREKSVNLERTKDLATLLEMP
jgi:hypothetical protein